MTVAQFRLDPLATTMADKSTEVEMEEKNTSKTVPKKRKKSTAEPKKTNAQPSRENDNPRMSVDSVRYENEDEERGMLSKRAGPLGTEKTEILIPNRSIERLASLFKPY